MMVMLRPAQRLAIKTEMAKGQKGKPVSRRRLVCASEVQ